MIQDLLLDLDEFLASRPLHSAAPAVKRVRQCMERERRFLVAHSTSLFQALWNASLVVSECDGYQLSPELQSHLFNWQAKRNEVGRAPWLRAIRAIPGWNDEISGYRAHLTAAISVCPDRQNPKHLFVGSHDGRVAKFGEAGQLLAEVKCAGRPIRGISASRDGQSIVVVGESKILVLESESLELIREFGQREFPVFGAAFIDDAQTVAACGMEGVLYFGDDGNSDTVNPLPYEYVIPLCVNEKMGVIASPELTPEVVCVGHRERNELVRFRMSEAACMSAAAVSDDSGFIAVGTLSGNVHLYCLTTGKLHAKFELIFEEGGMSLAFSKDGELLVATDQIGQIALIEIESAQVSSQTNLEFGGVSDARFSGDSRTLYLACKDGYLRELAFNKLSGVRPDSPSHLYNIKSLTFLICLPKGTEYKTAGFGLCVYSVDSSDGGEVGVIASPSTITDGFSTNLSSLGRMGVLAKYIVTGDEVSLGIIWDSLSGEKIEEIVRIPDFTSHNNTSTYPFFAVVRDGVTVVIETTTGKEVAWYAVPLTHLKKSPHLPLWAGAQQNTLHVFVLEAEDVTESNRSHE